MQKTNLKTSWDDVNENQSWIDNFNFLLVDDSWSILHPDSAFELTLNHLCGSEPEKYTT